MTALRLSVVIPTFNRCESLRLTINGLRQQAYPEELFEVVIVSDGSTDGTAEMVAACAAKSRFKVLFFEQSNSGPSRARNRAIEEATGDVIVFLDDDVEPVPAFLEAHAARHARSANIAVIGPLSPDPRLRRVEPKWILWEHLKLQRIYDMFKRGGQFENSKAGPMHFYSGNASVARKWLVKVGGFDPRFTRQEDVELATRLSVDFGIEYFFEFEAEGIHRPYRTFESWLKIPRDYGRLDAQRVVDGTVTYESVLDNVKNRHHLSRLIAAIARRSPSANSSVEALLKAASLLMSSVGAEQVSLVCLSGLYNTVYMTMFEREYARLAASAPGAGSDIPTHNGR